MTATRYSRRMKTPTDVLDFWFPPETRPSAEHPDGQHRDAWFESDPAFDRQIRDLGGDLLTSAKQGSLDDWQSGAEAALALVIVLDQFPRNIFRDSPKAFETDAKALAVADAAITRGFDQSLYKQMRLFLYMPFQHAEDLAVQRRSLDLYARFDDDWLFSFAKWHHDVIARFGRFPHRNGVLGRESTEAEIDFLESGESLF